ncbi:L,D-transpeptidase [Phreatobacter sp.]|uniref:L,D-transpeptidase n=1 Tax=Phreatobacter sp. TaxID=1966341 RepID=UPI0025EBDE2E|nr:L,D-transpeptidase [Phreatobacter sp.]
MRAFHGLAALFVGLFLWTTGASASIVVRVDKTTQTMRVIVDGEHRHTWAVSTGRAGYNTPNGSYRPQRLERRWHSRKYGMAPMPYSIRSYNPIVSPLEVKRHYLPAIGAK